MSIDRISAAFIGVVIALVVISTGIYLYVELKSNRVEKIARDEGVIHVLFLFESERQLKDMVLGFFGAEPLVMGSLRIPRHTAILRQNPARMVALDSDYSSQSANALVKRTAEWLQTPIHYSAVIDVDTQLPQLIDLVKTITLEPSEGQLQRIDGSLYTRLKEAGVVDYQAILTAILLKLGADRDEYTQGPGLSLLRSLMTIDMSKDSVRSFLRFIQRNQTDTNMHFVLEGNLRAVNGIDELLLFPYEDGRWIRNMIDSLDEVLAESPPVHPFVISVEILNGTTREGLAERTARYLRSLGFQNAVFSNAERNDVDTSYVIGSAMNAPKIEYIQFILNIKKNEYITSLVEASDVTIVLGQDFDESTIQ